MTFTSTGKTALYMSKYHPTVPVVGATTDPRTYRRMALYRGVIPVLLAEGERSEDYVRHADHKIRELDLGQTGDIVIYVGGTNLGTEGNVNSLKVRRLGDD